MNHSPLSINTLGFLGGVIGLVSFGFLGGDTGAELRVATVSRPAGSIPTRPELIETERPLQMVSARTQASPGVRGEAETPDREPNMAKNSRVGLVSTKRPRTISTGRR